MKISKISNASNGCCTKQPGIMARPMQYYIDKLSKTTSLKVFPSIREQQSASSPEAATSIQNTTKIHKFSGQKDGNINTMESILPLLWGSAQEQEAALAKI
jgi:hypothetical protein